MSHKINTIHGVQRMLMGAGMLGVIAVAAAAVPVAAADVEREKRGSCTGSSRWELSLEKEFGRIEASLELDTTRSGRTWDVVIRQNGAAFVDGRRTTDREGEIDIERVRTDRSGTDTFRFRAVNRANGEVCRGTLSI